jgi:small GTP-binding protein
MTQALTASRPALRVAIVGHTNTGKTSLVRTLTRDATFGEVSNRPATTRHVEGATLLVDGQPLVELYDTPGLEDPIRLLAHFERQRGARHADWIDVIRDFLESPQAQGEFAQEAKALRQVLASDVALYVIDARDRVLGKNRDELEILGRCAKPVVPVLNFTAGDDARSAEWREQLMRVNMHAVAEFDTVVLNETGEQRLFEKMLTLLDRFRPTLEALIAERKQQRADLVRAAADLLSDLLVDVASYTVVVPEQQVDQRSASLEALKQAVRDREQHCVETLLEIFRFRSDDFEARDVPIAGGQWGMDLFNPASLMQFGIRAGSGAAAGGVAGLAIDAMTGGLSLGAAAVLGATIGAFWSTFGSHGRRLVDVFRGYTELRVDDATLRLVAARQSDLIQSLLRRGHASQDRIHLDADAQTRRQRWVTQPLPDVLLDARLHPEWSRLGSQHSAVDGSSERSQAQEHLAQVIVEMLTRA